MRAAPPWVALAAAVAVSGLALDALGVPSAFLFAALLLGMAVAIVRPDRLAVAPSVFLAAQAVTGVALGAYLESSSL